MLHLASSCFLPLPFHQAEKKAAVLPHPCGKRAQAHPGQVAYNPAVFPAEHQGFGRVGQAAHQMLFLHGAHHFFRVRRPPLYRYIEESVRRRWPCWPPNGLPYRASPPYWRGKGANSVCAPGCISLQILIYYTAFWGKRKGFFKIQRH